MKGFTITLDNLKFKVRFYHAEEYNTVVCLLENYYGDIYRGKAKCNTSEGDVYNEKEGESIALKKALDKYQKARAKFLFNFMTESIKESNRIDHNLYDAWKRRREKEDKKELE